MQKAATQRLFAFSRVFFARLSMISSSPLSLAIFCKVVDNYGDIGICWRLARQLQREHGVAVSLWVDDLASFRRICPAVDAGSRVAVDRKRHGAPLARPGRRLSAGRRGRHRHRILRLRYSASLYRSDGAVHAASGLAEPGRLDGGGVGRGLPPPAVDASAPEADQAFLLPRFHQPDRRPAARSRPRAASARLFSTSRRSKRAFLRDLGLPDAGDRRLAGVAVLLSARAGRRAVRGLAGRRRKNRLPGAGRRGGSRRSTAFLGSRRRPAPSPRAAP